MVVGLGNPGRAYARTRHNVGFETADRLAEQLRGRFRPSLRVRARLCRATLEGAGDLLLVKPQTYMNLSGDAVAPLMRRNGLGPEDVVVIYDDADLPPGTVRVRARGGAGGHNGMKSVMNRLGTEAIARIRIGVGRDPGGGGLKEHVLSRFSAEDAAAVAAAVNRAAEAVCAWARDGVDRAMNEYNG